MPRTRCRSASSSHHGAGRVHSGLGPSLASWAVLALCLLKDMLWGASLGIAAFQLYAALAPAPTAVAAKKKQ